MPFSHSTLGTMRLNNKETDECEKRRPLKFGMRFRRETIEIGGDSAHKFV